MSELVTLTHEGDKRTEWSPDDPSSLEAVKKEFRDLLAKGYAAFKMKEGSKDWREGEQIDEFDPNARLILLRPNLWVGG